ncbi:MAG: hypothetical protein R3E42_06760 [Burkholderiaceae bacterium]
MSASATPAPLQATAAELIAPGPSGHSSKGHAGGSGGGERDAAARRPHRGWASDPEAAEEAFSSMPRWRRGRLDGQAS